MKILALVEAGIRKPDIHELMRLEEEDKSPRVTLFQRELNADLLDQEFLAKAPRIRRLVYAFLPMPVRQIIEALIVKDRYDAIISWGEHLGIPLAVLMRFGWNTVPHVGIFTWISKPKKALLLKLAQSHLNRIIIWTSSQLDFALNRLKISARKFRFVRMMVDQKFFRPMAGTQDMICAAGSEMRDYMTLLEAIKGLDIRCHIAAGTLRSHRSSSVKALDQAGALPSHITVGKKSSLELRELYARSRFVVIPLMQTDTDNGITVMLEAMAMGKAVICSRTDGQIDILKDGKTGIFVPVGDPTALRDAIQYLWNNPSIAESMGKAGREFIEKYHALDDFVMNVKQVLEESIQEAHAMPQSQRV